MYTLTASNSRTKTLLAKIVVASVFGIVFTAFFSTLSPLFAMLGVHLHGLDLASQQLDYYSLAWHVVFYGWGMSMFALMFAVLLRNQVAVIVAYMLIPGTVENLLGLVLKHNIVYLPFQALGQVLNHQMIGDPGSTPRIALSYGYAALIVLGYLAVGWIASWILFVRRDAN